MKKAIYLTAAMMLIGVLALTLVACNNATTQGQLADILNDHNHERFVYDVYDTYTKSSLGTYTVTLDSKQKGDEITDFGGMTFTAEADGTLISGVLNVMNGEQKVVYHTGCYFNLVSSSTAYMLPAYSYRTEEVDGKQTLHVEGKYNGANYAYTRVLGEDTSDGSIKLSAGTYFDNNEFHQVLRSVTTFENGLNLTFSMPLVSANEVTAVTLTAMMMNSDSIHTEFSDGIDKYKEDGIPCYVVAISRSTQLSNQKTHALYYATDYLKAPNENYPSTFAFKNALVRIVEPYKAEDGNFYNIEYNLVSATLS